MLIQYRPNQYRHAEPCHPPGAGPRFRFIASIVAGSALGWESLKPLVHPALWQILPWMPNPRYRRYARIAQPACAALWRYTGRRNPRLVHGSRSFRSAKSVSRSWCLLIGFVGCCERADNAFRCPSFQLPGGRPIGQFAAAARGVLRPRWAFAEPAREKTPRRWYRVRNLSRMRTVFSGW